MWTEGSLEECLEDLFDFRNGTLAGFDMYRLEATK